MIAAIIILIFTLASFNSEAQRIPTDEIDILKGKRLYVLHCINCHNGNPTKPGSIGPDLYTTPENVFRTKVPTGIYPSGYSPKRRTKVMPKFPNLTKDVDLIYTYIRSFKNKE
jgi:mono/diheme cytochrome c family protein